MLANLRSSSRFTTENQATHAQIRPCNVVESLKVERRPSAAQINSHVVHKGMISFTFLVAGTSSYCKKKKKKKGNTSTFLGIEQHLQKLDVISVIYSSASAHAYITRIHTRILLCILADSPPMSGLKVTLTRII